jgi:hypothetical protein
LSVDGVTIRQTEGPVDGREVYIQQLPIENTLAWQKAHHQSQFGVGGYVTLADLPLFVDQALLGRQMVESSKRCTAALGLVAACLDERATFRHLFDNLILFDDEGNIVGVLDHVGGVRNFGPTRDWSDAAQDALQTIELADELRASCRWFLKGVVGGPSEDGIMFLATALESIVNDPSAGKQSFDVKAIRSRFEAAGGNESDLPLDIGRCAGMRARVIHKGLEDDAQVRPTWYSLERIARTLLRKALGYDSPWPLDPSEGMVSVTHEFVSDRQYVNGQEV